MTRVRSIALVAVLALTAGAFACGPRHTKTGRRVIVLGVDGMDYDLVRDLMARGRLPHLAQLAQSGGFAPLRTTVPPQSPVAWSKLPSISPISKSTLTKAVIGVVMWVKNWGTVRCPAVI